MRTPLLCSLAMLAIAATGVDAQRYAAPDGALRIALSKQPFSPNGTSPGPERMATGGIRTATALRRGRSTTAWPTSP